MSFIKILRKFGISSHSLRSKAIFVLGLLLFCSLATFVVLAKRPLCLDSELISKVDRWTDSKKVTAFSCARAKWIPFDQELQTELPEISKKLHPLELVLGHTKNPKGPWIEVIWLNEPEGTLRIQDDKIFISQDLMQSKDRLNEAVARLWLRALDPSGTLANSVLEGALAWVLLLDAGSLEATSSPWMQRLKMEGPGLLAGSTSQALGQVLFAGMKDLSVRESAQIPQEIARFVNSLQEQNASLRESDSVPSVGELSDRLEEILVQLERYRPKNLNAVNAWEHWTASAHARLQTPHAKFVELVEISPDLESQTEDLILSIKSQPNPNSTWALISGQKIWLSGVSEPLAIETFPHLKTFQVTYVSCKEPTPEILNALEKQSDRIFLAHHCGALGQLIFSGLLKGGFDDFAKDNPNLSFVQLHMGSMPKTLANKTPELLNSVYTKNWSSPLFLDLGWQRPEWDQQIKAFRAHSVNDAIQAFR